MTMTTTGARRNPATMAGHALALTCKQAEHDRRDAHRMHVFARLRVVPMSRAARLRLLAGVPA